MNFLRLLVVVTLGLFSYACSAERGVDAAGSDQAPVRDTSAPVSHASNETTLSASAGVAKEIAPVSVCGSGDQVVFSCPLATVSKIASLCAVPGKDGTQPAFYYAFGQPDAVELRFPPSGEEDNDAFSRTHLGFAGNTGGYAYSFANAGYEYIVYSISGEGTLRKGGVIVQSLRGEKAATKLSCRSSAITETSDDALVDATLRLSKDLQIEASGLPDTN